jgi:hypothetical protein
MPWDLKRFEHTNKNMPAAEFKAELVGIEQSGSEDIVSAVPVLLNKPAGLETWALYVVTKTKAVPIQPPQDPAIAALGTRVGAIETSVGSMGQSFAALTARANAIEARLDKLEPKSTSGQPMGPPST